MRLTADIAVDVYLRLSLIVDDHTTLRNIIRGLGFHGRDATGHRFRRSQRNILQHTGSSLNLCHILAVFAHSRNKGSRNHVETLSIGMRIIIEIALESVKRRLGSNAIQIRIQLELLKQVYHNGTIMCRHALDHLVEGQRRSQTGVAGRQISACTRNDSETINLRIRIRNRYLM